MQDEPAARRLSLEEAAALLRTSTEYLVSLLDRRLIPILGIGTDRPVSYDAVVAFKDAIDCDREAVLAALVADAEDQGFGYSA